jgi:two-component system chemotaxis response regulator CheB
MDKRNVIVIGASAGGFEAIRTLVTGLPADFDAVLLIVWHISPDAPGVMPQTLNRHQTLPAVHAVDGEPLHFGRIYVAPPDHHLLVEEGVLRVTRGPKENRFRPAIDPLFRSAAQVYGTRVIGIILSGSLDDGSAGLWTIKQYGGLAVVQDPADAQVSSMPQSALNAVDADYVLPVRDMAPVLVRVASEEAPVRPSPVDADRTTLEINIAMDNTNTSAAILHKGTLSPYTCPECHGVLTALTEGGRVRFRCHTGHAFSAGSLLTSIGENIEENLWAAVRSIQENVMLLNHMGDHFAEANQPKVAAMYFKKAQEAAARADALRKITESHEQLSNDAIASQALQDEDQNL